MILFDRLVNVVLRSSQDYTRQFPILTPSTGVKPDVTVAFNMLEAAGTAYGIQVEVMNISQDKSFNIYEWDLMDVEIGYQVKDAPKSIRTHTMTCAIFNAYTTGPNPDGTTVFVGIVGSHMRDVFVRKPIYIVINKPTITVRELVGTVAYVIGHTPDVPKEIEDYELTFTHPDGYSAGTVHYKAENGLALVNWLRGLAEQTGRVHNETWTVIAYNNRLSVIGNTGIGKDEEALAVKIDAINSMTLTGTVIDIEAPYNPLVYPGVLVAVKPQFYTSALPNSETPSYLAYKEVQALANALNVPADISNLYRVLTMEVKFGTRSANVMKFKAVGGLSAYTGATDKISKSSSTASERMERSQSEGLARVNKHITVTDTQAMVANAMEEHSLDTGAAQSLVANTIKVSAGIGDHSVLESATSVHIHFGVAVPVVRGELNAFLSLSGLFAAGGQPVTILDTSTTFATLASQYYDGKVAYKDITRTENNPNPPPLAQVPDDSGGFTNPSIPCEFFAPIIALATYNAYLTGGMEGSGYANVAECITSSIPNGKVVVIPSIPDDITAMPTYSVAFTQYANMLLSDANAGVSDADIANYRQIAYYMESP